MIYYTRLYHIILYVITSYYIISYYIEVGTILFHIKLRTMAWTLDVRLHGIHEAVGGRHHEAGRQEDRHWTHAAFGYVGSCQDCGPFLGPQYNAAPSIQGTCKGTIILTTTHVPVYIQP